MDKKSVRKKIEALKKQRMSSQTVVSLDEYRVLSQQKNTKKVLVVDDEPIMRNALNRILTSIGYTVFLASDGLELSKTLEVEKLDLVVLDVNLPWVDGLELCQIIKTSPQLSSTPVVMISARKSKEDIELE